MIIKATKQVTFYKLQIGSFCVLDDFVEAMVFFFRQLSICKDKKFSPLWTLEI